MIGVFTRVLKSGRLIDCSLYLYKDFVTIASRTVFKRSSFNFAEKLDLRFATIKDVPEDEGSKITDIIPLQQIFRMSKSAFI